MSNNIQEYGFPILFGISGKQFAGKDTLATILQQELFSLLSARYRTIAFADTLKRVAAVVTGLPIEAFYTDKNAAVPNFDVTVGTFLQKLGQAVNNVDPSIWIKSVAAFIANDDQKLFIVTDVRYQTEAKWIEEQGGILIRINGDPSGLRAKSSRDPNHISETDLDNYPFAHIINNDKDLENLRFEIRCILNLFYVGGDA
jgi:hypothetical protein